MLCSARVGAPANTGGAVRGDEGGGGEAEGGARAGARRVRDQQPVRAARPVAARTARALPELVAVRRAARSDPEAARRVHLISYTDTRPVNEFTLQF